MSFNHPKAGVNLVPAYQMSGIPFVTSSVASEVPGPDDNSVSLPVKVSFPFVTKFVTVRNTGINELRVGFSSDGVIAPGEQLATSDTEKAAGTGRNYFLIPSASIPSGDVDSTYANLSDTIQTFEVRCKEIFFLSNAVKQNTPGAPQATSFSLLAGLTLINSHEFPTLTGSNGFEGVG